ncbi:MAG: helix-turn-helix transcriptional regulator [Planctomycetes bacterium]|nr:helix-turn-helix transcriptional regulator [Planctomycetota bacterium]
MQIIKNLKMIRIMEGLTQQDLFLKTGIQQCKISNFERGIILLSGKEKMKIQSVLKTKIDWDK